MEAIDPRSGSETRYTSGMLTDLRLKEMSLASKMALLEALWDDLSSEPEQLKWPEWHRDELERREARLQNGEESLTDWETAKEEIRQRIR